MKRKLAWIVVATFILLVIAGAVSLFITMPIQVIIMRILAAVWAISVLIEDQ